MCTNWASPLGKDICLGLRLRWGVTGRLGPCLARAQSDIHPLLSLSSLSGLWLCHLCFCHVCWYHLLPFVWHSSHFACKLAPMHSCHHLHWTLMPKMVRSPILYHLCTFVGSGLSRPNLPGPGCGQCAGRQVGPTVQEHGGRWHVEAQAGGGR